MDCQIHTTLRDMISTDQANRSDPEQGLSPGGARYCHVRIVAPLGSQSTAWSVPEKRSCGELGTSEQLAGCSCSVV